MTAPDDLFDQVETGLVRRVVELVSLARKSGQCVAGMEKVKGWLADGRAKVLFQACDGSGREKSKLWTPEGGRFFGCLTSDELGLAFGRQRVIHGALAAGGLERRVVEEAAKLRGLRGTYGEYRREGYERRMSDQDGKKPLGLSGGARSGRVNQSFSRGRTKSVVVETKRKRVVVPKPGSSSFRRVGRGPKRPSGVSDSEMERRLKALQAAKAREGEEAERREREEREREEERARKKAEIEAKEREEREREEALKAKAEEDARRKQEEQERKTAPKEPPAAEAAPAPAKEDRQARAAPTKTGAPPRPSATRSVTTRAGATRAATAIAGPAS